MLATASPAVSSPVSIPLAAAQSAPAAPRLLDQVRQALRTRRYNPHTEELFVDWIRRYVVFHGKRHPLQLAEPDVARYLSHLAGQERVSLSTQIQARAALVFLYRHVLARPLGRLEGVERAQPAPPAHSRERRRPPNREEIQTAKPRPPR